ncbi:MAG: hypothetical protein H6765_09285 [Candidatus Peribacteria bacterium]|nr:MAG: hypothetical protein H6765_09285 [Candidatus Peribacteria bacterium]
MTPKAPTACKRQSCQIITRVMGYFRPVSHYNIGKKAEFYSRTYFLEEKTQNSKFMEKYGS